MRNIRVVTGPIKVGSDTYIKMDPDLAARFGADVVTVQGNLYQTKKTIQFIAGDELAMMPVAAKRLGAAVLDLDRVEGEGE